MSEIAKGQFDASRQERIRVQERAEIRTNLRKEFLKLYDNPHRMATGDSGYGFDPVLQRWLSMRSQYWHYFKPNTKTLIYPFIVLSSILSFGYLMTWDRNKKEESYRTGQVSYRDRRFKFV